MGKTTSSVEITRTPEGVRVHICGCVSICSACLAAQRAMANNDAQRAELKIGTVLSMQVTPATTPAEICNEYNRARGRERKYRVGINDPIRTRLR